MSKSLDSYGYEPSGKREYLQNWGYHFSKKACEWAISLMRKRSADGREVEIKGYTLEEVNDMLNRNNIKINNFVAYDAVYLASMIKADYWGSSIEDELHMARHIKDVLDDVDGSEDSVFCCWYMKMIKTGTPVLWEEIM